MTAAMILGVPLKLISDKYLLCILVVDTIRLDDVNYDLCHIWIQ